MTHVNYYKPSASHFEFSTCLNCIFVHAYASKFFVYRADQENKADALQVFGLCSTMGHALAKKKQENCS